MTLLREVDCLVTFDMFLKSLVKVPPSSKESYHQLAVMTETLYRSQGVSRYTSIRELATMSGMLYLLFEM